MKFVRRQFLHLAAGAAALPFAPQIAWAQAYPARPITMVIGYAAGGPTDVVGRVVANAMRASLGQPIVIENVAGANGTIGTGRVVRAAGDGYTIGFGNWNTLLSTALFMHWPTTSLTILSPSRRSPPAPA